MWHTVKLSPNQIKYETDKSVLVKMPARSEFKGYLFWFTKKLVRYGNYYVCIRYSDEFTFKLFNDKKHEIEIDAQTMNEMFWVDDFNDSYLEVTEPVKISIDVEVDESLLKQ